MEIEKISYKTWNNDVFIIEAIVNNTLWDKQIINDFQKNLNHILNEIYKRSNLINNNKKKLVSLSFSGEKNIFELNSRYRKINKATNVLSFPSFIEKNNEIFLGDIIFSAETIFEEAQKDKKKFLNHLIHLFIHGILHLLGYDHQTLDKAEIMESVETKILETMNIDNPYD